MTLRENAVAALEGLAAEIPAAESLLLSEEFVGNEGLLSEHRLKYERGTSTATANAEVDMSVCRLLDLMATAAVQTPPPPGDDADLSDNPTLIAALSVIEYLIRQYQIHANHLTAGRLLYTLLPLQVVRPTASYPGVFRGVPGPRDPARGTATVLRLLSPPASSAISPPPTPGGRRAGSFSNAARRPRATAAPASSPAAAPRQPRSCRRLNGPVSGRSRC